jgi:hypothetical protein
MPGREDDTAPNAIHLTAVNTSLTARAQFSLPQGASRDTGDGDQGDGMLWSKPATLPERFAWAVTPTRARLMLDDVRVLEVRQQRTGWVVEVFLVDQAGQKPSMAVRSLAAGQRWGAQWARQRADYLMALVPARTHAPVPPRWSD